MNPAMAVMQSAERRTGLSDWGDDEFLPRLHQWLAAIGKDSGLNELGFAQAEEMTIRHACNRLKLERLISDHPEILNIDLAPPIIVTGLPRSGTTTLAQCIAGKAQARWLRFWEAIEPFSGDVERRRLAVRRERDLMLTVMSEADRLHDFSADAFVDDTELQALAFGSYALEWHAHVPHWRDFYMSSDQRPAYRYLKRAMQALSWLEGPARWVIKSPQHMEQLRAIADVFPGSQLVVTRRDQRTALRSMDRVMDALGPLRQRPYPSRYWRERFAMMSASYEATRHLFPDRTELEFADWTAALNAGAEPTALGPLFA